VTRTLHVVALPHTTLTEKDASCAYSMKVLKFVPMMRAEGCRVVLYGPDEIECEPDEHVVITTEADRVRWGYGGNGYDTTTPFLWDPGQPYWFEANTRAADAIRERISHGDYLCLVTSTQGQVADTVAGKTWDRGAITVEWAVGYEGVDERSHAAYESYAWMHHVYGIRRWANGRAFDQVIPNFFDASMFTVPKKPRADYVLYIGRVILRKGPHIAAEIAKRAGLPLIVAGPGALQVEEGRIIGTDDVVIEGDVHYVGPVGYEQRNELMGNAAAVIVPTLYVEPFGGVAVEAMLAGAPVLASDWGSFTEIVAEPFGRRFRTAGQGAAALADLRRLTRGDRKDIRGYARQRFSLEAVGPKFTRWFDQLDTLWGEGWYA
jgi:glycosyltransferase involved in cell wall biosynthesis